jgi:cell division protease FtsH
MEGTPMVDGKSKSLVAYHEVGHAVCATLTPGHDPVQKVCCTGRDAPRCAFVLMECRCVGWAACERPAWHGHAVCLCYKQWITFTQVTLIPRGQARGLTWFTPGEDPSLISKSQIFARIVSALGGRAAEQVIFGDPEVTTGASGDLQQVKTRLVEEML